LPLSEIKSNFKIGMLSYFLIFFLIFSFLIIYISNKKNLFIDFKIEKHKRFSSTKKTLSIGGIIFFTYCLFLFFEKNYFDLSFMIFLSIIFFLGFFSDIKVFKSPKLRFLLQFILLILFIIIEDFQIPSSNIYIIDFFLNNTYFNKSFTIFCLMILLNGNNFIDGINTLLIGYNIILTAFLLTTFNELLHNPEILKDYLIVLLVLLFFNLNGKVILGDAGAYILAFFLGIYLIDFARANPYLSPFFIISLLWYPCFELLFSIIRRLKYLKKTYEPDTQHLHQLMYKYFSIKIRNNQIAHLCVSISINCYFLLSLVINKIYGYKSSVIIVFLIMNIIIYLISYFFFKKKIKN